MREGKRERVRGGRVQPLHGNEASDSERSTKLQDSEIQAKKRRRTIHYTRAVQCNVDQGKICVLGNDVDWGAFITEVSDNSKSLADCRSPLVTRSSSSRSAPSPKYRHQVCSHSAISIGTQASSLIIQSNTISLHSHIDLSSSRILLLHKQIQY